MFLSRGDYPIQQFVDDWAAVEVAAERLRALPKINKWPKHPGTVFGLIAGQSAAEVMEQFVMTIDHALADTLWNDPEALAFNPEDKMALRQSMLHCPYQPTADQRVIKWRDRFVFRLQIGSLPTVAEWPEFQIQRDMAQLKSLFEDEFIRMAGKEVGTEHEHSDNTWTPDPIERSILLVLEQAGKRLTREKILSALPNEDGCNTPATLRSRVNTLLRRGMIDEPRKGEGKRRRGLGFGVARPCGLECAIACLLVLHPYPKGEHEGKAAQWRNDRKTRLHV